MGVSKQRGAQGWFTWFIHDLKPKLVLLAIFPLYLCLLFGYPLSQFNTTDRLPEFSIIDAAKQREFGSFTVKVKNGMYIKNFTVFDIINNRFVFDALVWFEFRSNEIMLETIGNFGIDNGRIISRSAPDLKVQGDLTLATYDVRIECLADLDYTKFPLEDHRLSIIMTNNSVTPYEMFFLVDNTWFNTAPDLSISNWKIRDLNTDSGYFSPQLDSQSPDKNASFPKAIYTINLQKSGARKVLVIFIPIFLAMMLSFFSFLMSFSNMIGRFTLASSGVSAQLGYRFVIEKMIPEVSYFTVTDKLYLLLLIVSFLIFITQLFIGRHMRQTDGEGKLTILAEEQVSVVNGLVYYSLLLVVLSVSGYFVLA